MRDPEELRQYAVYGKNGKIMMEEEGGSFRFLSLFIIASWGNGWDHVSVSRKDRCPTWEEMEMIKRRFFKEDETCFQLHVPPKEHINNHPYCLHMWRPHNQEIPLPPMEMV